MFLQDCFYQNGKNVINPNKNVNGLIFVRKKGKNNLKLHHYIYIHYIHYIKSHI